MEMHLYPLEARVRISLCEMCVLLSCDSLNCLPSVLAFTLGWRHVLRIKSEVVLVVSSRSEPT